jgi:hypothetical protein
MNPVSAPVTTPAAPTPPAPTVGPGSPEAVAVAQRLRGLASEPSLADRRAPLEQLAQALSDPDHAAGWEGVPLHPALGYPIPAGSGCSPLASRLAGARVALVFVPVAVTWAGVAWAGYLYQRELARDPDLDTQSFFRLWLTGFDGAMPSFHVMAVIIATAVFAIIGLTVWMGRDETRDSAHRQVLQARLHGALTEAAVHLARGRPQSPERFVDSLTRVADGLASLVTQVHAAAMAATGAMQGATAATEAAGDAATRAEQAASALAGSTDALAASLDRTETATTRLVTDALAQAGAAASRVTAAVTTETGRLTAAVTTETGRLATAVADAAGGLTGTVDALRAQQDRHLDAWGRQLGEGWDQLSRELDQDRDKLGLRLAEHEQETRQLLPELVDRIADAQTRALDSHLAQLRDAIRQLAQQQQALASALAKLRRRPATAAAAPPAGPPPAGRVRAFLRRFRGD